MGGMIKQVIVKSGTSRAQFGSRLFYLRSVAIFLVIFKILIVLFLVAAYVFVNFYVARKLANLFRK